MGASVRQRSTAMRPSAARTREESARASRKRTTASSAARSSGIAARPAAAQPKAPAYSTPGRDSLDTSHAPSAALANATSASRDWDIRIISTGPSTP